MRDIKTGALKTYATDAGEEYGLPIIPLTESLSREIKIDEADLPKPQVFSQPEVRSALRAAIRRRADTVVGALVDNDLKDATSGFLSSFKRLGAKHFGTDFAVGKANANIFAAIDDVTNAFYEG